jgi:hypothetical protein
MQSLAWLLEGANFGSTRLDAISRDLKIENSICVLRNVAQADADVKTCSISIDEKGCCKRVSQRTKDTGYLQDTR